MNLRRIYVYCLVLILAVSCSLSNQKNIDKINQAESFRNLGEAYLAAGNPTLALRELLKANSLNPKDPYTHNDLGLVYLAKSRTDKAINHFKIAIELNPGYAPAVNNLGSAYLGSKDFDKAILTLIPLTQNMLYATPHFAESNLAYAYMQKGNLRKAEYHYLNSIDLSPNYITSLRGVSILYRNKGEFKKSLKYITKAIKISPAFGELYYQKGITLKNIGDTKKAKKAFEMAIRYGDDDLKDLAQEIIAKL